MTTQPPAPVGQTFFFTVRLYDPNAKLLVQHIDVFRHAVRSCRQARPFSIGASVVLPNRVHMIWTLPPNDADYGSRWKQIKATFAQHVPTPRRRGRLLGIWQRRYWETEIRNPDELAMYERLIRDAPVDDGLRARAEDWPYSSFAREFGPRTIGRVPSAPDQATAENAR